MVPGPPCILAFRRVYCLVQAPGILFLLKLFQLFPHVSHDSHRRLNRGFALLLKAFKSQWFPELSPAYPPSYILVDGFFSSADSRNSTCHHCSDTKETPYVHTVVRQSTSRHHHSEFRGSNWNTEYIILFQSINRCAASWSVSDQCLLTTLRVSWAKIFSLRHTTVY